MAAYLSHGSCADPRGCPPPLQTSCPSWLLPLTTHLSPAHCPFLLNAKLAPDSGGGPLPADSLHRHGLVRGCFWAFNAQCSRHFVRKASPSPPL